MKNVKRDGVDMVGLTDVELASLDARIASLDDGTSRTYTDEELDEKWRREDAETNRHDRRQAA